ncbi:DNA cytosine methyltransferase [Polluticaenibacter yanchengensis]|uniref:DNA cytosine methyltransferase n=1 Tax=Polluticaenibacter yanchengensis TaxID=3014562 RepID=A0ABT4UIM4_9BACT|nr:DNA cytosine methyltransferase [Chitinophagaceae bacterium LY-5]
MKVLNLYACLGGNRLLWDDCEVTAVELDPELARLYQERFPNDKVIVGDAHKYLLDHYKEFDFIWSSPPCPTHSRMRKTNTGDGERKSKACYPDMKLYEEIIFLDNFFKGKYCVENVVPYYEPLVPAQKRGRHMYWTNFPLPNDLGERKLPNFINSKISLLSEFHNYDFMILSKIEGFSVTSHKKGTRIDKIARNLVDYEAGKTIFDTARGIIEQKTVQTSLFGHL